MTNLQIAKINFISGTVFRSLVEDKVLVSLGDIEASNAGFIYCDDNLIYSPTDKKWAERITKNSKLSKNFDKDNDTNLSIDESLILLEGVMRKILNFDNDDAKNDFLLDMVRELKEAAYDKSKDFDTSFNTPVSNNSNSEEGSYGFKEFAALVKPLIKYLNDNDLTGSKIIIDCEYAELVDGMLSFNTNEFNKD
jgi:hydrogenase maturation factor HypE